MSRGLDARLGTGTWDTAVAGLVAHAVVSRPTGGIRSRTEVVDVARRDALVATLREAAAGDASLDPRTAVLLSMTGPAQLLEVVAPERGSRRHARQRIDHALDRTELAAVGALVRRVIADAAAVAASTAVVAGAAAATSG